MRHRTGRKRKERKAQKTKKEKKKRQRRGTAATSHQPLTPSASVALKSVGSWLHMSVAEQGQYHHVGDSVARGVGVFTFIWEIGNVARIDVS